MEAEIHAKLTGAGGGGCVLCLPKDPEFATNSKKDFFELLTQKGYTVYDDIKVSEKGLKYKLI